MTNISRSRIVRRDTDRLFPHINNLLTLSTGLGVASTYIAEGRVSSKPGDYIVAECKQFDLDVRLPFHGPIQAVVANRVADAVELNFVPKTPSRTYPILVNVLADTLAQMIASEFAMFYESHLEWLEGNHGSDGSQWPAILDFARVIRNSASHSLKLTFRNPKSRAVKWHHIEYGPTDNGKRVIGADLSFADMIVLMFEISDEYDRLNCPVPC